jgi:NADPH2:quinone reductase
MKRIIVEEYGGPENLVMTDSEPPSPGPGEVLIRIRAAGINPVDAYRRAGSQGYAPDLPFCPGFEGAGEVISIGAGGEDSRFVFAPGDRVYVAWSKTGTYGQWCLADAAQVFPLPMGLSWSEGAALFVNYFTAYRALMLRGGAVSGERVLVHGASGGVGLAALQWCSFLGNPVWGTAGSVEGRELISGWGAAWTADHGDPREVSALARDAGGFDLVLEMRAEKNLDADLDYLAPGGRIMVIGSRGETPITPRKTMGIEADIRGVVLFRNSDADNMSIHRALEKAIASRDIQPVIRAEYPMAEAPRAHEELMREKASGKRILVCDPPD